MNPTHGPGFFQQQPAAGGPEGPMGYPLQLHPPPPLSPAQLSYSIPYQPMPPYPPAPPWAIVSIKGGAIHTVSPAATTNTLAKHNDTSTCSSRYCRWTCTSASTDVQDCCNSNMPMPVRARPAGAWPAGTPMPTDSM